ncbi:MAG: RloB domain-containing protein [Fibrobacteres bacterium]|nr:RloB domain-containing protein [Fibrobacterota bacterium]
MTPRDDHPRDRQRAKLERKQGRRQPGRRFLVVCEGKKTEPGYLQEMRAAMRIHAANLFVAHEGVTEPRQIVDAAWEIFQRGKGEFRPKAADVVVAIFDRDEHRTYHDALDHAASLDANSPKNDEKRAVRFLAVPSNSCFELWLLLHFKDQQTPIHRHDAFDQVRGFLPDYDKGMKGLFAKTRDQLPTALQRAYRLADRFDCRADGPWTGMHLLVHLLLDEGLTLPKHPARVVSDPARIDRVISRLKEAARA